MGPTDANKPPPKNEKKKLARAGTAPGGFGWSGMGQLQKMNWSRRRKIMTDLENVSKNKKRSHKFTRDQR